MAHNTVSRLVFAAGLLWIASGCERSTAPMLAHNSTNVVEIRRHLEKGGQGGEGAKAAATSDPTGWSTFRGRFVINGSPPPRSPLKVDKDLEVCAAPGVVLLDESVVIGSDGGIKNVLVYLSTTIPAGNPKWEHESYREAATEDQVFDQKECRFLTHVFAMRATQELKVLNSDPVGHNTNLNSTRGAMSGNFTVPAGGSVMYEPKKASPLPFPVSCSIHPWMNAWMMVCDSPYFAVTGDDGSFEIKNVPAGVPLEFRVWQEKAGYLQSVTVNGTAEKWSRGKLVRTFTPDTPTEIQVAVDAGAFR